MTDLDQRLYHVTVLLGPGHDAWFDSAAAALHYADMEMDRLMLEHEDLGAESFDGIFCRRRDTGETWRYEVKRGEALWVPEGDGPINYYDSDGEPVSSANHSFF